MQSSLQMRQKEDLQGCWNNTKEKLNMGKLKLSEKLIKEAENYYKECIEENKMPYMNKLAIRLGVNNDTLNEWSKSETADRKRDSEARLYRAIAVIIKKIKDLIEQNLLEMVSGERKGNAIGAMFRLKAQHGYVETSKQVVEGGIAPVFKVDMSGGFLPAQQLPISNNQANPLLVGNQVYNKLTGEIETKKPEA